jgi:XTP/dITP diphosphohydrolase
LAHKVVQRATRAGFPADLIPAEITSITVTSDIDVENALRTAVLEFMDTVRGTEKAVAAERRGEDVPAELDVAPVGVITEEEWRACWPPADGVEPEVEPADAADEPAAKPEEDGTEAVTPEESVPEAADSDDDQSNTTEP